jgi:pimeloyl-ACP methyl ester carboxylesterase
MARIPLLRRGSAKDTPDLWGHTSDEIRMLTADDGVVLHVEIDAPASRSRSGRKGPAGPSAEPTVVLVHGFTLSSQCWVLQRRSLIHSGFRVVTYDQRSHGKSGPSPLEHCTVEQLGEDLHRVIEATCPTGPIVLVGHSMGGMTLMSYAAVHPDIVHDRVLAAAFIATSPGGSVPMTELGLGPGFARIVNSVGPGVLTRLGRHAGAIKQLRRMGSGVQDALIRKWAFDSPVTTDLVSFVAEQFFSTPFEVIAAFLPSLEAHDQTHGLTAYSGIETLVVNGTGDLITPPEHSEELVRRLPGAEHVLIEDGGHVIMLEHPQIVSQQILMLIARAQRAEEEGVAVSRKPRVTRTITDLGARALGSRSRSRSTTAS